MATSRGRTFFVWLAGHQLLPTGRRSRFLRRAAVSVGSGTVIRSGLLVTGEAPVSIGAGVFINTSCRIDASAPVSIGPGVALANDVKLMTSSHEMGPSSRRAGKRSAESIVIGDGAWLGTGVIVLPGVTVARGCVIGAGAVVREDTAPDGLYVGVPARRVRDFASP